MAAVRWRPQALRDLESVEAYLESLSPDYAQFFVQNVFAKARQLGSFPYLGRVVPEIEDAAIRQLIYRSYRIIYVVGEGDLEVEVLTVIHSSRQLGELPGAAE